MHFQSIPRCGGSLLSMSRRQTGRQYRMYVINYLNFDDEPVILLNNKSQFQAVVNN